MRSSVDLLRELSQVLPADEYDLDAITQEIITTHGLVTLDELGDAYADIAIRHQVTDPAEAFAAEVVALVTATPTGEAAVWARDGVQVRIFGQSRATPTTPTPGARITIESIEGTELVAPETWADLHTTITDTLDQLERIRDGLYEQVEGAQKRLEKAEQAATVARTDRDAMIRTLTSRGESKYRIAKRLGLAESTVGRVK